MRCLWASRSIHWCTPLFPSSSHVGSLWLLAELWKGKPQFQLNPGYQTSRMNKVGTPMWAAGNPDSGCIESSAGPRVTVGSSLLGLSCVFEMR